MAAEAQWLWGIHAGETGDAERLFLINGYVGLGWQKVGNLGLLPDSLDSYKAKLKEVYPEDSDNAHNLNAGQLRRFVHVIQIGDYVAFRPKLHDQGTALVFLGRVTGPYLYNPFMEPGYPNLRRVEWLRSVPATHLSTGARSELGAYMSLFKIDTHAAEFFAALAESK